LVAADVYLVFLILNFSFSLLSYPIHLALANRFILTSAIMISFVDVEEPFCGPGTTIWGT
jgi:hypothetical protein